LRCYRSLLASPWWSSLGVAGQMGGKAVSSARAV
jgi:hypothetical protein